NLGGLFLNATGVGAIIGVPANVISTGLMVHGGGTAIAGGAHLLNDLHQMQSRNNEGKNSGPKAKDAPGVTSSGQATDEDGNKRAPSGKAQINKTRSGTREGARNRALSEGSGAVEHKNPRRGDRHFH